MERGLIESEIRVKERERGEKSGWSITIIEFNHSNVTLDFQALFDLRLCIGALMVSLPLLPSPSKTPETTSSPKLSLS